MDRDALVAVVVVGQNLIEVDGIRHSGDLVDASQECRQSRIVSDVFLVPCFAKKFAMGRPRRFAVLTPWRL
jgi:hypothetical protein